jgi:hypothetical protein
VAPCCGCYPRVRRPFANGRTRLNDPPISRGK